MSGYEVPQETINELSRALVRLPGHILGGRPELASAEADTIYALVRAVAHDAYEAGRLAAAQVAQDAGYAVMAAMIRHKTAPDITNPRSPTNGPFGVAYDATHEPEETAPPHAAPTHPTATDEPPAPDRTDPPHAPKRTPPPNPAA